jgi:hypothetical protein
MDIKDRTESFDSITSSDSFSFDDNDFNFGENRDRSSSISFMMDSVKHMERKNMRYTTPPLKMNYYFYLY